MVMNSRENRRKKAYDESNSELSFTEWKKLNYEHFGENNVDWIPLDEERDDDDEPKELNFDHE